MSKNLLLFAFFSVVFPMLFFATLGNGFVHPAFIWNDSTTTLIFIVFICSISKRLADLIFDKSGTFNLLRIPFSIFYYVFFLLIPANLHLNNVVYEHITVNFSDENYRNSLFLVLVSYLAYTFGDVFAKKNEDRNSLQEVAMDSRRLSRLPVSIFALCAFSAAIFFIIIRDTSLLFLDRTQLDDVVFKLDLQTGSLVLDALVRVPAFCALYFAFYLWTIGYWKKSGLIALLVFLVVVPVYFVFNFPPSVPRLWLGGTAFAMILIYLKKKYGQANLVFASIVFFSLMIVFPLFQLLRFMFSYDFDGDFAAAILSSFSDAQFDAFSMLMTIQDYAETNGFTGGWQTLSGLLFFVPRAIFQSKGISTGKMVGETLGFTFTNISSPFLSEIFIDFNYWGIIPVFFLFGYASRRIEVNWTNGRYGLGGTLYVPYLAGWQFILLRGSMFTAMNYLLPVTIVLLGSNRLVLRESLRRFGRGARRD